MANQVKNPPAMQDTQEIWIRFLGQKDPLEEGIATHSRILALEIPWTDLPGKSHGQRSMVGYSPWHRKESDRTEQLRHTSQEDTR